MSRDQLWFSACVRFVVLVDGADGAGHYADSVVVFRALDWDEAQARAIAIGREREAMYSNADGVPVMWRLKDVTTLDQLGRELEDGREVFWRTERFASGETFGVETRFRPDKSRPNQSGA